MNGNAIFPRAMRRARFAAENLAIRVDGVRFWRWARRRGRTETEAVLLPVLCNKMLNTIDVGANLGMYVAAAFEHSRKCHAFEPVPGLADLLSHGFRRHRNVEVHRVALSDHAGLLAMRIPKGYRGRATVEPSNALLDFVASEITTIWVNVQPLDELPVGPVGLLKIDVEGHEPEVLRGAKHTIAQSRPNIILEAEERHRPSAFRTVRTILVGEHDYVALSLHERRLVGQEEAGFGRGRNFIFVPRERAIGISAAAAEILRQDQHQ